MSKASGFFIFVLFVISMAGCAALNFVSENAPPDMSAEDQGDKKARIVDVETPVVVAESAIASEDIKDPVPAAQSEFFKAAVISPYWSVALNEASKILPPNYEIEIGEVKNMETDGAKGHLAVVLKARRAVACTASDAPPCEMKKDLGQLSISIENSKAEAISVNSVKFVPPPPVVVVETIEN